MKKMLFVLLVLGFAFTANAAPTLYGKINKEVRMYDEDADWGQANTSMFQDVQGSPSRFGFKGSEKLGNMTVKYRLEAKWDSSATNTTPIQMRHAHLSFVDSWGTLTIGQAFTATAKIGKKLDPLSNTGADLAGGTLKGNTREMVTANNLAYLYRSRKDLIKYESPKFMGFQLLTSYDRNDVTTRNSNTAHRWEKAIAYGHDFGAFKLDAWVASVTEHGEQASKDDFSMTRLAARFGFGDLTLAVMMDNAEETSNADVKTEDARMMLTGKYKMGKNVFAVTYGKHETDLSTAGDKTREWSQMAAGIAHNYTKNFQFRVTYAAYDYDWEGAATTVLKTNSATILMLGTQLKF